MSIRFIQSLSLLWKWSKLNLVLVSVIVLIDIFDAIVSLDLGLKSRGVREGFKKKRKKVIFIT